MRRYTFNLLIALTAFGSFFSWQNIAAQTVSIKTEDNPNYVIPCQDKYLRLIWQGVKNEFTEESTESLTEIGVKNCNDLFEIGKIADLNGDKIPEILVHQIGTDCPASGNCTFWVFQKKKNGYQSISTAAKFSPSR